VTPFWIRIVPLPSPSPLNLGIGVTARSADDARALVAAAFGDVARIAELAVIRAVDHPDQRHVVPNMGNILARGIRFPLGADR
jgi:hypothetical protein